MKYFNSIEENEFYTSYQEVNLEDCDSTFIDEDTLNDMFFRRNYIDNNTLIYIVPNMAALKEVVAQHIVDFNKLPENRVSVKWNGPTEDLVLDECRELLKEDGYTIQSGRVKKVKEKAKFNTHNAKILLVRMVQRIFANRGIPLEVKRPSETHVQILYVEFMIELGYTFDTFCSTVKTSKNHTGLWCQSSTELNMLLEIPEAHKHLESFWKSVEDKELTVDPKSIKQYNTY